jgi:hypothetical protein
LSSSIVNVIVQLFPLPLTWLERMRIVSPLADTIGV